MEGVSDGLTIHEPERPRQNQCIAHTRTLGFRTVNAPAFRRCVKIRGSRFFVIRTHLNPSPTENVGSSTLKKERDLIESEIILSVDFHKVSKVGPK